MKCSELYRMLTRDGWYSISQNGSHIKMRHAIKKGVIIFPNHGSSEMGKGLEKKLLKQAGIKV
jgi:mRNA interferase HicA